MKNLSKEQWLGLLRHTLTFIGGVSITLGYVDESAFTEVSGLIVALVGTMWSILTKK